MKSIAALSTASAFCVAVGALAASPAQAADRSTTTTAPMHLAAVTKVLTPTPDRNGKVRVQLSNGQTISILASHEKTALAYGQKQARIHPNGTVYGDCGNSSIDVTYKSDGEPVHMDTGFSVIADAVEYAWSANIAGDSGTGYDYDYSSSGGLAFRSDWDGHHDSGDDYPSGTYAASVDPAGSWAMLDDGSVCYSGGPYDSEYLYA